MGHTVVREPSILDSMLLNVILKRPLAYDSSVLELCYSVSMCLRRGF